MGLYKKMYWALTFENFFKGVLDGGALLRVVEEGEWGGGGEEATA